MKTLVILLIGLLPFGFAIAQRGDIIIPTGASITVPLNAQICADRFFANNPGYGTLTLADPSGLCTGAVITPVELLTFTATFEDGSVLLQWITETEIRNFGFEVQRKTERGEWTVLGFVEGYASTNEPHSYEFTDALAALPDFCRLLRYRLKQIDLDGQYAYSPEVEVGLDQPLPRFALEGYPSPCDDQLTVRFALGQEGAASIRLHDIMGRVMMVIAQDAILPAGNQSMWVRTADIPSGLYLLVVESREGRRSEKVLIRH
ncbi:MAG: T9SS type A sorting domain-containing protein [Bacteroidota bacterium]|jgi:hypothetical protein